MKKMIIKLCFLSMMIVAGFGVYAQDKSLSWDELAKIDPKLQDPTTYTGTCDDLHTVTSFNDLFTQIYRHLEDQCFFLMSKSELSGKLGINVIAERGGITEREGKTEEELIAEPYKNIRNGVFLSKRDSSFVFDNFIQGEIYYSINFSDDYLKKMGHPLLKPVPNIPYPHVWPGRSSLNTCNYLPEAAPYVKGHQLIDFSYWLTKGALIDWHNCTDDEKKSLYFLILVKRNLYYPYTTEQKHSINVN